MSIFLRVKNTDRDPKYTGHAFKHKHVAKQLQSTPSPDPPSNLSSQVRSVPSETLVISTPLAQLPVPSVAGSQAVSPSSLRLLVAGPKWTPNGMYTNSSKESVPKSPGCVANCILIGCVAIYGD